MKVLIIDCDALGWQVFHSMPALSHKGQGTGVIYGFLESLIHAQSYVRADRIAFAWDSKDSKRRKLFPEYKIKRRTAKKEYTEEENAIHNDRIRQFLILRKEVLPALGFKNILHEDGYEGDDIIASIALKYRKKHRVVVVARDGDLYQLINENCVMHDTKTRATLDEEWFFNKYGIYPDMWAEAKSLVGCKTDEVPGIPGIGDTRAISYLLNKMKKESVFYKRIKESQEIIKLTRKLVVLPYKGTPKYKLKKDKCTTSSFNTVARKYGFKTFLSNGRLTQYFNYFVKKQ